MNDNLSNQSNELENEKLLTNKLIALSTLGLLTAELIHEIATPLAAISTNLLIIKKIGKESEPNINLLNQYITKIERNVESLIRITYSIKNNIYPSTATEPHNISLNDIVGSALELCQSKLDKYDVSVQIAPHIEIDTCHWPADLSQVFVNLINNAVDSIKHLDNKWIKIDFKDFSDHIEIHVTDSGTGIDEQHYDNIFNAFYTTKEKSEGAGLGLSISKKIIERHCGHINLDLESEHTKFIIKMPKAHPVTHIA